MKPILIPRLRLVRTAVMALMSLLPAATSLADWTNIIAMPPGNKGVEQMLLLSDGTVMAQETGGNTNWFRLTPDSHGNYIRGTWSTLAPMNYSRQYYSSAVLRDGRVFVAGGEYGTGGNTAEIYDPLANAWTVVPVPPGLICTNCGSPGFSDSGSVILPDGNLLIAPVSISGSGGTVIFNVSSNTFFPGPSSLANQNEATWVKLPDDSILTIDPSTNPNFLNTSERFIPSLNKWIPDTSLPVPMYNGVAETGAGVLLPDGRVFFIGGNGQTAYYTPSGGTNPGSWTVGPTLVSPGVGWDEPAAMMPNGKVLFQTVLGPPQPQQLRGFYELDPTNGYPVGTLTETPEWGDNSGVSHIMLDLPDGNVLVSYGGSVVKVYRPNGGPSPDWKPSIASISRNPDGSYHLTGTQLNGISQGSSFGDDAQMDSNYPLVRLVSASGEMTYARTFNWSSTSVQTRSRIVSTEFSMPGVIAGTGPMQLQVVANGIASDPVPLPFVSPGTALTFDGTASMGSKGYEIQGGTTRFEDDGSASGILLRGDGGIIQLLDSATAATASIAVDGGPGNGGLPGHLLFHGSSTAANADIVNLTGVLGPNFKNVAPNPTAGLGGQTRFFDSASAGAAHIANAAGAYGSGFDNGITSFEGNASADHAVFANFGVSATTSPYAYGGETYFTGTATAASGVFTNYNSNNGTTYSQGRTVFFDHSTAANGTFVTVGGNGGFLELGGTTEFRNNASAGNGAFINQGSTAGNFPGSGATQFFDDSVAGTGRFTNGPGVSGGASVEFYGHSSADHGTFINQTDPAINGYGGSITFKDDSTAGFASITNRGYQGGAVHFRDRSSADHATIVLESHPNYNNSRVDFWDTSTAGNAVIFTGSDGTLLQFNDSASAGSATLTIAGNAGFSGNSTAGDATITVLGSTTTGDGFGNLGFIGAARTGNGHFVVQGATVSSFGAGGGVIAFDYGANAGSATFTINGGSNGGPGGGMTFSRGGDGGQARFIVNAGGRLDFGGTTLYGGATAGSIEGAGEVILSSTALTVGSLNSNTVFSGEITDGQLYYPGVGGQLIKVGTGALTLSGTNTYTGLTTVSEGTLAVNGSIKGDVLVKDGATLKGSGNVAGTVTAAAGAIVSPGNSPGTLTIGDNYTQTIRALLAIEVAGPNPQDHDLLLVKTNVDLAGNLLLIFSGYAPAAGDTYTVVQAGGNLTVNDLRVVVIGLEPGFQPTYRVEDGKLIFSAASSGRLTTTTDPLQAFRPWYSLQHGFTYPVFTATGAGYEFDTSTDLKTWTPIAAVPGADVLYEFRDVVHTGEPARFYRVVVKPGL